MSDMVRCFIAIEPPSSLRPQIAVVQSRLRAVVPAVKPTRLEQAHLTLAFLGDIGAESVELISSELAAIALSTAPFELRCRGAGAFPSMLRPRVVWLGISGQGLEQLNSLQSRIAAAARSLGIGNPDPEYHPHITIARIGSPQARVLRELPSLLESESNWTSDVFTVNSIAIYGSVLGRAGAVHTPLDVFPFALA